MRFSLLAVAVPLALVVALPAHATEADDWHRVVGILQYLAADYPEALASGSQFELDEQDAFIAEAVRGAQALGPAGASFVPRLQALEVQVKRRDPPDALTAAFTMLIEDLATAGGLQRSPRRAPDLQRGEALYQQACASCHAADGSADVPIAKTLEPPPANFLDPAAMSALSAYKSFNVITHGLPGTAMVAFKPTLPEESDRWALAFFVLTLRHPPCEGEAPKATLEQLATLTDPELAATFGEAALPCLRRAPPSPDEDAALILAQDRIREALRLIDAGDPDGARQAVLDAYLLGVEPVEPKLAARDPGLVRRIEARVLAMRVALERDTGDAKAEGRALLALLDQARHTGGPDSPWAVFWMALLIVLREGFEALVVVGALLAVLKKMGASAHARLVHAGWISALVAGALAFAFAQALLAGANREWVEGVVALAAVAMLLYAALWLNARANMSAFMKDLRGRMVGTLGRGSGVGLFVISFSAVGRESFETALFLQGLALDSAPGAAWGGLAGLAVLAALVWGVLKVGFRLPMKPLFRLSTAFLFGTAVVLLGKGLHALQEVGALPLRPVSFARIDLLGVYPDLVSLGPQLVLALLPLGWWIVRRARGGGAPAAQGAP